MIVNGYLMSEGLRRQVVHVVQTVLRSAGVPFDRPQINRRPQKRTHFGKLTSTLAAASNPLAKWDSLPTATFEIYDMADDGSLSASGTILTVYSRRDIQIEDETFVEIENKRGKWHVIDANCSP